MKTEIFEIRNAKNDEIGGEVLGLDLRNLTPDSPELVEIRSAIYRNKLIVSS
ncbi:hypothetical protein [Pedobacter sp. NJ-S-72]